jgi:hypothetical protein
MKALLSLLYCVTTEVRWLRCSVRLRCLLNSPLLLLLLLLPAAALLLLLPLILQACQGGTTHKVWAVVVSVHAQQPSVLDHTKWAAL